MQKITPFLWFDNHAVEAVNFYSAIFNNSRIIEITHYEEGAPFPKGSVMTVRFSLDGQEFVALNGGPQFNFSPAVSFVINCDSQEEVDEFWEKLSAGGETLPCGWLRDKFGLTWQVVPRILLEMLNDPDSNRAQRVMMAMLQMTKIDIERLQQAHRTA
jgi:predicted 3-demethylubiquinone-9 3-methyltransferase (glyoxalase superfamily)